MLFRVQSLERNVADKEAELQQLFSRLDNMQQVVQEERMVSSRAHQFVTEAENRIREMEEKLSQSEKALKAAHGQIKLKMDTLEKERGVSRELKRKLEKAEEDLQKAAEINKKIKSEFAEKERLFMKQFEKFQEEIDRYGCARQ